MKKSLIRYIPFILFIGWLSYASLFNPEDVSADSGVVSASAELRAYKASNDYRVISLRKYLAKQNSPLTDQAAFFVESADRYFLDWRLVPAITGVESSFGKRIPSGSYNAYGWANGKFYFSSWEESIEVVAKTLRQKYYDKGAKNINQIARRYAPPSSTWAGKVRSIMRSIDKFPLPFALDS